MGQEVVLEELDDRAQTRWGVRVPLVETRGEPVEFGEVRKQVGVLVAQRLGHTHCSTPCMAVVTENARRS
jgi:hypothetical protein